MCVRFGTMSLCNAFFDLEVGGHNSRASTIVHQARLSEHRPVHTMRLLTYSCTQALRFVQNGGLDDHVHGEKFAQELALSYPHLAATNADNHEYFAVAALGDSIGQGDTSVRLSQVYFGKHILDL